MKRVKSRRYPGVYIVELEAMFGTKHDKSFYITYRDSRNKLKWEKVGRLSENVNEKFASEVRAERIMAIKHGDILPHEVAKEPVIDDFYEKYLEWAKANKNQISYDHDRSNLRCHILPYFHDKTLTECTDIYLLEQFVTKLVKQKKSPSTVRSIVSTLRCVINKGKDWGICQVDATSFKVQMPKINNGRMRFLAHQEAEAIIDRAKYVAQRTQERTDRATHEIIIVSLMTGARISEILSIRPIDINFENGVIVVRQKNTSRKDNHDYGYLHISTKLAEIITDAIKRENVAHHKRIWPYTRNALGGRFDRIVDACGLNDNVKDNRYKVVFHTLRHTFASWLAIQGETLLTIKELMRHSDISMTMRYAHLCPDMGKQAIARLEETAGQLLDAS